MTDFSLIQDKTGDVYKFTGNTPPDGCVWMPPSVIGRVKGTWNAARAAQVCVKERSAGENAGKVACTVWSRIVGYYSAVNVTWHPGKVQEWKERKTFSVPSEAALENM